MSQSHAASVEVPDAASEDAEGYEDALFSGHTPRDQPRESDATDEDLPSRDELWAVIQSQQQTIESLEDRVSDLEAARQDDDRKRKEMAARVNEVADTADNAVEDAEKAREVAKSASAIANQAKAEIDTEETSSGTGSLPADVEPSSSPLDFFSNCRKHRVKQHFVEEQQKTNTYRALRVAKRWEEFATQRTDGSAVFYTRASMKEALTAVMGEKPHETTVTRVWEELRDGLGGEDVVEKRRRISTKQEPKTMLEFDMETAEGLLENRYYELDLLDAAGDPLGGGVTPVVTGK